MPILDKMVISENKIDFNQKKMTTNDHLFDHT